MNSDRNLRKHRLNLSKLFWITNILSQLYIPMGLTKTMFNKIQSYRKFVNALYEMH